MSQFPQTNVTISGCNFFNNAGQGVRNGGSGGALVDASNPLPAAVVLDY